MIKCEVNSGDPTVTYTVLRLDPEDEVMMTTNTPHATLEWVTEDPFKGTARKKIYVLPRSTTAPYPLRVDKQMELSPAVVRCGVVDHQGKFWSWPRAGFPDTGTKNPATRKQR